MSAKIKYLTGPLAMILTTSCASSRQSDLVDTVAPPVELYSTNNQESVMYEKSDRKAWAAADETLATTPEATRNVAALTNRAQIALLDNKLAEAEKLVRSALAIDLKNTKARRVLAQVFFRKGEVDSAEIALTSLGDAAAKDPEALNLNALIALKRNKASLAMSFFKKALTISPTNAAVRMNLGVLYLTYRQINPAAVQFERILADHPDHLDAKFHLAVARSAMGQSDYSKQVYEEVLDAYDDHPFAMFNLAILQADAREYGDAIDNLKAFLRTEHAKTSNNKEVFAMIEEFERDRSAMESGTSDEDIQKMAAKSLNSSEQKKTASTSDSSELYGESQNSSSPQSDSKKPAEATKTQDTAGAAATPTADTAKPKSKASEMQKKPASVDADIDMLQKELSK
jgi:Tfp pilus assembly protein PilF